MAIKVTCPRCNTALQVPPKLLGQYTQCPACQNRILIPPHVPQAVPAGAADEGAAGLDAAGRAPAANPSMTGLAPSGPNQSHVAPSGLSATNFPPVRPSAAPSATVPAVPAPAAPGGENPSAPGRPGAAAPAARWSDHAPPPGPAQRKTARFITADSVPSTVHLAPNGELPKLQLAESAHQKQGTKDSKVNPLVLVGAACLSFCFCVVLLLSDFEGPAVDSTEEAAIRQTLESYYKNQEGPLAPYQVELRDAQQARSRGDHQAEQLHYRKVLNLLHAERDPRDRFRGLTGTPKSDQDLEKQLARLLTRLSGEGADESN